MAASIKAKASNHLEIARFNLLSSASKVYKEERLRGFNPTAYESLEQYVVMVLMKGTMIQRAGLIDSLDQSCDLSVPELKQLQRAPATELLKTYITQTCNVFATDFKGDLSYALNMMYDNYGGITLLEWARFFNDVCQGKYKTDFQSVNTRGINVDFLNDWIQKYCNHRESLMTSLRNAIPDQAPDVTTGITVEQIQRITAEHAKRRSDLQMRRKDWEASMFYTEMVETSDVRKNKDGVMVNYHYEIPMTRDKPEAAYKRLYALIEVFYFCGEEGTKEKIEELLARWELERVIDHSDVKPKDFYRSQAASLHYKLIEVIKPDISIRILIAALTKLSGYYPSLGDFQERVTGLKFEGENPEAKSEDYINRFFVLLSQRFKDDYFKAMDDPEAFPLSPDEYYSLCCIRFSVDVAESQHPFSLLIA